ncbi:MAG: two-component system phosphate regulon sensor histidine kinase PhoR [Sphingobacteriales bacterium]|jgi:two-component system phosphate regulon sensor histidine kinase PhoR
MVPAKRHVIISLLLVYLLFQILWWAYLLTELYVENCRLSGLDMNEQGKRIAMVMGEGAVFIIIMSIGGYLVSKNIRRELEVKERQSNFLLAITHELKTPLASLKLLLQTFSRKELTAAKKEQLLPMVDNQLNRIDRLINELLLSSKVENREVFIDFRKINFDVFFTQRLKEAYEIPDIWNRFFISGPSLDIFFDPELFWLVLSNLLDNAIKYSPEGSPIHINWEQKAKGFIWEISNEGKGISKKDAPFIFDKFYRAGNETTRESTGTGIGLYLCKNIVQLHGGTLDLISNTPAISTFRITLPHNEKP